MPDSPLLAEFYELGLGEPHPVSAAHGQGVVSLAEAALEAALGRPLPPDPDDEEERRASRPTPTRRSASPSPAGPNVGKSTLINAWLGEERLVAFDQPGTTRDAIVVPFERGGRRFDLIDTAGLRRRGKVFEAVEKFSVVKTLQAIAEADVVLLLLDATQGVTDQDAHIAGYILESGRAVVVAVNKWDAVDAYAKEIAAALDRAAPAVPEVRAGAQHLGEEAPGLRPGLEGDRRRACFGDAQDADAGADAPAPGSGAAPDAQARRRVPAEAALRAPGRHEAAGDRHPRQLARARDRRLQALPGRAASGPISSSPARRCGSRCARRRIRSWRRAGDAWPYDAFARNPCVKVSRSKTHHGA